MRETREPLSGLRNPRRFALGGGSREEPPRTLPDSVGLTPFTQLAQISAFCWQTLQFAGSLCQGGSELPGGAGGISARRADPSRRGLCLLSLVLSASPSLPWAPPSLHAARPGVRVGAYVPCPLPRQLPDHTQSRAHQTPEEQKRGQEAVSHGTGAPRPPGL